MSQPMKKKSRKEKNKALPKMAALPGRLIGAALFVGIGLAHATEQDNSVFEGGTNTFNNWIEFSAGGMMTGGNRAEAEQRRQLPARAFGGIEDLHYQATVATNVLFSLDGRSIYDNDDYSLTLGLTRPERWFLRVHAENFRTWYNGDGGFYPPGNVWFPLTQEALSLDRGEISVEGSLTLKKWPTLDFKYSHLTRDGEKGSTIWGQTHPSLTSLTRGIAPSFYGIDEARDIFELNAGHHIKNSDFGVGLRYETGQINNARYITQFPGEVTERKITDREGVNYDMFNVHAFSETAISKKLLLSAGFLFTDLDNGFSGSRIYSGDFDVSYAPNAMNGAGFYNLSGGSHKNEYVGNLNLMYTPLKHLTITPSLRVQKEEWNADSGTVQTLGNNAPGFLASNSEREALDVRERLDVRYTGITNCILYAHGEWTQGEGNLDETGGIYLGGPIQRQTEDSRFFQKYTAGCRLYPARFFNMDFGGYFKKNNYDYDHTLDSTPNAAGGNRYPAFLVMQDFTTYDGFTRLTLRPMRNLMLVSRYEYQLSTIHTQPSAVSGLAEVESSEMTSHILAQNISWTPWSRLYFQVGFNYVVSETETPTSDHTQAILDSQNNYWTVSFNSGLAIDNKTDFNIGYTYYRADDYMDNSSAGLPLGSGAEEHGITAVIMRRLSARVRVTLRYGFYHSEDELYGGHRDYDAHVLFSSLQYRF
jgi:hypothetical protein